MSKELLVKLRPRKEAYRGVEASTDNLGGIETVSEHLRMMLGKLKTRWNLVRDVKDKKVFCMLVTKGRVQTISELVKAFDAVFKRSS